MQTAPTEGPGFATGYAIAWAPDGGTRLAVLLVYWSRTISDMLEPRPAELPVGALTKDDPRDALADDVD